MIRRSTLIALPVLALALLGARKPDDPKHENHFKASNIPASEVLGLQLQAAQAQQQFVAVDTKVTNKTSDQLIVYKKGEATFVLPSGPVQVKGGGLFGGPLFIQPGDTRSFAFKIEGDSGLHVDTFSLQPKGAYIGSNSGTPVAAPEFALPASRNDFTAGPFSCKLGAVEQKTDKTAAAFACVYNGKGLGIVEPARIGVKEPGGQEYANVARKAPRDVLLPGDTSKFTVWFEIPANVVDMQFAKLQILFRDAFAESTLAPVALEDWKFEIDAEKTAKANK